MDRYYRVLKGLLRVPTYILMLLYFTLGLSYAAVDIGTFSEFLAQHWLLIVAGAGIVAAWYVNGTGLNDFADYEIDQVNLKNDPDRPIVIGAASKEEVLKVSLLSGAVAVCLAALISVQAAGFVLALLILNWTYSLKPLQISRRGGLAPLLLPLGYVVLPLGLAALIAERNVIAMDAAFAGVIYLQFLARIVLKDYRDVKGDKQHGKITFLLKYGTQTVCRVSTMAWLAGVLGLMIIFRAQLGVAVFPLALLAGFAVTMLQNLARQPDWPSQKPLIAAFGRLATGVTTLATASFMLLSEGTAVNRRIVLLAIVATIFIYSAYEILNLQTPTTKKV